MLKQKIRSELISALKEKQETVCLTLRGILAAMTTREKEKRYKIAKSNENLEEKELAEKSNLADEEIIEVISSEAKKRKDAIVEFEKGGRADLAKKEKQELDILQKYLPEPLQEEEIRKIVKEAVEKTGAKEQKDMGKVMAQVMREIKGRADGSAISKIVKEFLSLK